MYPTSYELYKRQRGLSAAEQRAADIRAGQIAAEISGLWLDLRRAFRLGRRVLPGRRAASAIGREATGRAQALTSDR